MRYGDLLRRVAENIQDLRRAQGLTQEETAHRAKLSTRALASIERGETSGPTLETLHAVAEALGVEVVQVVGPKPEGDRPEPIPRGRKPRKPRTPPRPKPGDAQD